MAFTGGTAVPSALRESAAAHAMGGGGQRVLNKASGKMETAKAIKAYKAPGAPMKMPMSHTAKPTSRPPSNKSANAGHSSAKAFYELGPGQLQHLATKEVQQETKANLQPYQQKAGEIAGTEQTVAKRFGGYGEATDKLLGGLQSSAEGSAKTYGNLAAEQALKAQSDVANVGQNTQAANGNYLDPQVRAALANQSANVAGIGAARTSQAESQGQNETNFMTNLRAAAAQRATEGQSGITSTFGKQQAANQAGENQLLAREPGAISKLATEYGQKEFTDRATEQGLGIKAGTLRVGEQNAQSKAQSVRATESNNAQKNALTSAKLGLEGQKLKFSEVSTGEKLAVSKLTAEEKARYDQAQERYKTYTETHGGKAPSAKEGRSYMSKLSSAESIAAQALAGVNKGRGNAQTQAATRKLLAEKGASADVISAALNLAVYGRLGPVDQHVAESYGLTKELRPQWFAKGK